MLTLGGSSGIPRSSESAFRRCPLGQGSDNSLMPLEPEWDDFAALAHRAVDDMIAHLRAMPDGSAWQPTPAEVSRALTSEPLPMLPQGEAKAYEDFLRQVLPYPNGNIHPRYFGWVNGSGLPLAALADFLASSFNPHLAGFNQAPKLVEQRLVDWMAELMGFPEGTSGVMESGGTMASVLAIAVARHACLEKTGRDGSLQGTDSPLVLYASTETHGWVKKGMDFLGLGRRHLREVPVKADYTMDIQALEAAVARDKAAGLTPFCVVGTAGTVQTGAFDDLEAIADFSAAEDLWFHVDGAFGALLRLSDQHRHMVKGLERADSLAVDLHKWMYMPFEVACLLVRDPRLHKGTFAYAPSYISSLERGTIAGGLPFSDLGMDLSRSFKALKAWMCLKAYGVSAFAEAIDRNMEQTRLLVQLIEASEHLELMAPAPANVACFRYKAPGLDDPALDALNLEVLLRVQESGDAVPSSTLVNGRFIIRYCNVNHRTTDDDIRLLVDSVERHGRDVVLGRGQV